MTHFSARESSSVQRLGYISTTWIGFMLDGVVNLLIPTYTLMASGIHFYFRELRQWYTIGNSMLEARKHPIAPGPGQEKVESLPSTSGK